MLWAKARRRLGYRVLSMALATLLITMLVTPGVAVFAEETTASPDPAPIETGLADAAPEVSVDPVREEPAVVEKPAQVPEASGGAIAVEADPASAEPSQEVSPVTVGAAVTALGEGSGVANGDGGGGPREDFPDPIVIGEGCELVTVATFWAGQNIDVGTVSATNDAENLYVTFETTGGWTMGLTHLYVGLVPPGSFAPGSFPYQTTHDSMVTSFVYTIPLADIGAEPGDTVHIAAHAEVHGGEQSETAWAGVGQWPGLLFTHTVQECPEPPEPSNLTIVKFHDLNGNGEHEEGEPVLEGFTFTVDDGDTVLDGTTGPDGMVLFEGLLPGEYEIDEVDLPEGWSTTRELPIVAVLAEGQDVTVHVGNAFRETDIRKSFRLVFSGPAEGLSFEVDYVLGEEDPVTVPLLGEGPYDGDVELPRGSTIAVRWYAVVGEERVLLGTTGPETLLEDTLNEFEYVAEADGYKFDDVDADGAWDEGERGIEGWTILLFRVSGGEQPVAMTTTGADGGFHFDGLLPGLYRVAEEERDGWFMTVGPEGFFEVGNGSFVEGLIFGNAQEETDDGFINLAVTKDVDGELFAPGDTVTYTLRYRNLGDAPASDFTLIDDYDERYMAVEDAAGGTVADGKITWALPGPLSAVDGERTITYTMRVRDDVPDGTTVVENTVVISHPSDADPDDDEDGASVEVENPFLPFTPSTEDGDEEDFLPFTGGEYGYALVLALLSLAAGLALRTFGAQRA